LARLLARGVGALERYVTNIKTKQYRTRHKVRWRTPSKCGTRRSLPSRLMLAMSASKDTGSSREAAVFDTDSQMVRIDNCATASLSNDTKDFIGEMTPTRRKIKGIDGHPQGGLMTGTIRWYIEDDAGVIHEILLPGSYYVPWANSKLLSPQHWAQRAKDNHPVPRGTWCATYADTIVLEWDQRKHRRTVRLDPGSNNVAHIRTAPGFGKFSAFLADADITDGEVMFKDLEDAEAMDTHRVSDDEDLERAPFDHRTGGRQHIDHLTGEDPDPNVPWRDNPLVTAFDLQGDERNESGATPPNVIEDEEDVMPQGSAAEFLRWHHRLCHLAPAKMKLMARMGILPKTLIDCPVPLCTACLFGKATRRPWRTRAPGNQGDPTRTITKPGDCVSIDQLVSVTPGLIAQAKGSCTTKQYRVATVFVDHFSRMGYVHVQKGATALETIEAKNAFERYSHTNGVTISHYHADNGIFADNLFRKAVEDSHQTISFCGVNAHWQNGIAERRIRELQDSARTMMIHANRRWPTAITANLWPYALRMANHAFNATPTIKSQLIPTEVFTGSKVAENPRDWHHFGAPVYVLDNHMQSARKIDKWTHRARVGVYLGRSAQHARSVSLVLSLESGLVSPQFHIKVDSTFQTMRASFGNKQPISHWQRKCGFLKPTNDAAVAPLPRAEQAAGPVPAVA